MAQDLKAEGLVGTQEFGFRVKFRVSGATRFSIRGDPLTCPLRLD